MAKCFLRVGAFLVLFVLKIRPKRFREEIFGKLENRFKLGKAFDILVKFFIPIQILAMIVWWFGDSYPQNPHNWYNPSVQSSIGTVLFQWGVAFGILLFLNKPGLFTSRGGCSCEAQGAQLWFSTASAL